MHAKSIQLCPILCNPTNFSTPGFSVLPYLPELAQTHVHWVSDSIQPSHPLLPLLLLPSIFPSIRVFFNKLALHSRWPKYWSFSFRICPSNKYSRFISFRIDWFDLLSVQGTLKSLLQHHKLKASILWLLAFFMVQLSHPNVTAGKSIALTTWKLKLVGLNFTKHGEITLPRSCIIFKLLPQGIKFLFNILPHSHQHLILCNFISVS